MYKQIAENKRKTIYIIIVFVLIITAIAALFAWYYQDPWIAVWTTVAGIVYAVIQYYASSSLTMVMSGAHEIQKKDNPRL